MISIQLKRDRAHHWLLWWTADGKKWYPINSKNVKPTPNGGAKDPFEVHRPFREVINKVYAGSTEKFEGAYDSASKKLAVKGLEA